MKFWPQSHLSRAGKPRNIPPVLLPILLVASPLAFSGSAVKTLFHSPTIPPGTQASSVQGKPGSRLKIFEHNKISAERHYVAKPACIINEA